MSVTIWSLDSATKVYRAVTGFILFHRPVEWAHQSMNVGNDCGTSCPPFLGSCDFTASKTGKCITRLHI